MEKRDKIEFFYIKENVSENPFIIPDCNRHENGNTYFYAKIEYNNHI